MIIDIIGWIATFFRSVGMLCKSANTVKYLVSVGNLFWMINGILSKNAPLIVSNAICLAIMVFDVLKSKRATNITSSIEIKDEEVEIFDQSGKLICKTSSELEFDNIRIQLLKSRKIKGCQVKFRNRFLKFDIRGELPEWPDGLFTKYVDQKIQLMELQDAITSELRQQ